MAFVGLERSFKRSCLLACGTAAWVAFAQPAFSQSFNNFYVFGDSLSDAGTFRSPLAPTTGLRFTTNPGLEWDQILGASYGITVSPYEAIVGVPGAAQALSVSVLGGNNYAQGGACVASAYSAACPMNTLNTLGVSQQIGTYLSATGGRADPGALYAVYGGGNDVLSLAQNVTSQATPPNNATLLLAALTIQQAGAAEAANVQALVNAGAKFILVPNLPDVGNTPLGLASGTSGAAFLSTMSSYYNQALNAGLQGIGGTSIIYADIARLASEIIASPASYGLVNATTPACATSSSIACTTATLVAPNADKTYFFADDVHPTTAIQQAEAQYIASILSAPGKVALLAETADVAARSVNRALDSRIGEETRFDTGWSVFGNADIAPTSVNPGNSTHVSGTANGGHVGVEYGGTNGLKVGTISSYTDASYDFSGSSGRYSQTLFTQTFYGIYSYHSAFAQLSATIGRTDFDNVRRVTPVLADTRVNSGGTHGTYAGGRLLIGNDHHLDGVVLTPLLSVAYEQALVEAYSEGQGDSTSMNFGQQRRRLFVGTAGAKAATSVSLGSVTLNPSLTVLFNSDFQMQKRYMLASVNGAPTSFAMPVTEPGHNWTSISGGVEAPLSGGVVATLYGGGSVGQRGASSSYANIGLSYRF